MTREGVQGRVSVVIPTYRRAGELHRCVDSVLAQDWPDVEAVVADDCSPDGTKAEVERRYGGDARVKYLRTERNGFASAARNAGAAVATGEWLFFLDDDNVLSPDCVSRLVECFRRDEALRFVAPATVTAWPDGTRRTWTHGARYNRWTSRFVESFPLWRPVGACPPPEDGNSYRTVCSPNAFMCRRRTFMDVGGFDEGYGMQFDETDFGLRATGNDVRRGGICPLAVTEHLSLPDSGVADAMRALGMGTERRAYCFGRNRSKFARRHGGFLPSLSAVFVFAPLSAVCYCLLALRHGRPDVARGYLLGTLAGILGIYETRMFGEIGET